MATTGLSADPEVYRSRLADQSDDQIDAWAAEMMRDVAIRRGVVKVVTDFRRAAALDEAGFERVFASGGGPPAVVGRDRDGRLMVPAITLFALVLERRREIGVLKAIGARDRDVRRIFLIEAGITGFIGGLLGTLAGYGIARILGAVVNQYLVDQGLPGVGIGLPVTVFFGGVFGASVLAVLAGIVPAQRAARLPARQAMGDA